MLLKAILGPVGSIASTWLEGRNEKIKANTKVKVARAEAEASVMEKKATGEIDWDLKMADASAHSWKDEWLTIIFSIPLILSFCGDWGRQIVSDGFMALETMPTYYQYTLGTIVAASFGTRAATKFFGKK